MLGLFGLSGFFGFDVTLDTSPSFGFVFSSKFTFRSTRLGAMFMRQPGFECSLYLRLVFGPFDAAAEVGKQLTRHKKINKIGE